MAGLYDRQRTLSINTDQKFAVVGCGGIGFHVAKMLAMAGVEEIILFDPDNFEEHNLNRIDLTEEAIGKNKAETTEEVLCEIRPLCYPTGYPFEMKEHIISKENVDWIIDCTDKFESQQKNMEIAKNINARYVKAGYNGFSMSISNTIGSWDTGNTPDGYTIVPSFVVPAVTVAALVVGKVLKYQDRELSANLRELYK